VVQGNTRREILRVAEENGVDLIVLGSHGRQGIQLLLGSTANAVLHGAPCDVLAVRVKD
jgi:universal stress protein A